jgi:uncharacterized metal-binding protein (TIGR02443 family)
MQAKCPKCGSTAFRMFPESQRMTEVECLHCGHITTFIATVTRADGSPRAARESAGQGVARLSAS